MLINALCEYADLQTSSVPDGWCEQDIHYEIILSKNGQLLEILDVKEEIKTTDKKGKTKTSYRPKKIILPQRTQKSGIESNYIEHRPLYIFGLNYDKDNNVLTPDDKTNKARKSHSAFAEHELEFMAGLNSDICTAYKQFIQNWNPENETNNEIILSIAKDLGNSYFTFSLGIGKEKLEKDKELINKYNSINHEKNIQKESEEPAVCGILGKKAVPARLHNKIKFPGGQSSGCQLICMNGSAFESYGKTQSFNSNVSEEAMLKYTSAFNYLLSDKIHNSMLGDMTLVYFAIKENDSAECSLFSSFFNDKSTDITTENELNNLLRTAKKGITVDEDSLNNIDKNTIFYIAGFTPNSSRICQKFIIKNKFGDIISNLNKHQNDLQIDEQRIKQISFYNIAKELVSPKSQNAKVPSPLFTNIMLAALNNTSYPDGLLSTIIQRIKTDSDTETNHFIKLNNTRAGIIKACLIRKYKKEDITMSWNDENKNSAYLCGGLFAIFEKIQKDASSGTLNKTIKDAYFSSACSRPSSVFPKITKLANIHMRKLSEPAYIYYNKLIQTVSDNLEGEFPATLSLDDQGRFIIGYYQMNQKLYKSNKTE